MFDPKVFLPTLPSRPGIYQMLAEDRSVLYVGKAKRIELRNRRIVEDVIDSLHASGIRQFILLNGHIWNNGALDVSAEKLRVRHRDCRVRALGYVTMYPGPEVDGHVLIKEERMPDGSPLSSRRPITQRTKSS